MFHEITSHSCQQAQNWQGIEHEIFIDGMLFLAQSLFCIQKTESSNIIHFDEDAALNRLLKGDHHSHKTEKLRGFLHLTI